MAGAIEEMLAAAEALPPVPESGSEERKAAHSRLMAAGLALAAGAFTAEDVALVTAAQPLVGVKAGAEIIGKATPNFRRYRGRLIEIPVEGSASVFVRSEVEALGAALVAGDVVAADAEEAPA
jgi:hypothetical protein